MQKLLIADSNEEFRQALAEILRPHYQVLCCSSGKDALEILRCEQCDVFILDLMLPELDGITLLEQAVKEGIRPMVLAVSPIFTKYIYAAAERLGIGYLMVKPCPVQAVSARVCDLSTRLKPVWDSHRYVSELLFSLGISTKYDGFRYLREAILLMAKEPGQPVTKVLYPAVAKICDCKDSHVERSIRNALDAVWDNRDVKLWQQYFPEAVSRPSNTAFITRLAEELRAMEEA